MALNKIHLFLELWILRMDFQNTLVPSSVGQNACPYYFLCANSLSGSQRHLAALWPQFCFKHVWPSFVYITITTMRNRLETEFQDDTPWCTSYDMFWALGCFYIKQLETSFWNKGAFPPVALGKPCEWMRFSLLNNNAVWTYNNPRETFRLIQNKWSVLE